MKTKTRLFIVEGVPGSGKSTTSKYIADLLRKAGENVVWLDEGTGEHPADYEFHSFLTNAQLAQFSKAEQSEIKAHAAEQKDGVLIALKYFSGKLLDRLMAFKIYDGLPWEQEKPIMLQKWSEFAVQAREDTVYVFNCCLLQNPMCETMIRFGCEEAVSEVYIQEIANILAPLNPIVLYLYQSDVKRAVLHVCRERPDSWLESVIRYHIDGAYGLEHGLKGFDGYISCLEERQRREVAILEKLPCEKWMIEDAQKDWSTAQEIIKSYLSNC